VLSIRCRLIKYYLIYVWLTLTLAKVCPHSRLITTEKQEKAFEELKRRFTEEPVLAAPDLDKKMQMEVDASNYGTGGVLSMESEDKLWRPVAFLSKSLNETERNYEIHDKEMLAIIRGLEAWRHLLEGAQFKFEI